ncbi:MAG: NEW3 domain-containing protein, partial [Planifilum fimeticola]
MTDVDLFLLSRKLDDPIYDFGFSKSPEETLEKWGEEVVYERLIRLIRQERPDILMPSFRDVPSQHGHHRAVAQLTLRAFADAADPKVFPQHLREGLSPWQVKKLYLPGEEGKETLRFNIGMVDPVYGKTYPQLGEESRKLHKSQGMGRDLPVEDYFVSLELVKSSVGDIKREKSLFDGLPVTLADWAADLPQSGLKKRLVRLQSRLDGVIGAYPDRREVTKWVQQALMETRQVIRLAEKSGLPDSEKEDLLFRLRVKERQLLEASVVASRVDVAVKASPSVLTRGSTGNVVVTVDNGGEDALTHLKVDLKVPEDWRVKRGSLPRTIQPGESRNIAFEVKVPEDASFFDPYAPPV